MLTQEDLDNWFSYHSPKDDQPTRYGLIRDAAKTYAQVVLDNTPQCGDQVVALRKIRESVMMANLTIACNE